MDVEDQHDVAERPKCKCHSLAMHRNGRGWRCAAKNREYGRQWREANPEKVREQSRRQRESSPEKAREYDRRWRQANPEKVRELGRRTYRRQRTKPYSLTPADVVRFWGKVAVSDECWEWQGHTDHYGYGQFKVRGYGSLAHRVAYELLVGGDIDGHHLHHSCGNKLCVNPDHLVPLTPAEHREAHRAVAA